MSDQPEPCIPHNPYDILCAAARLRPSSKMFLDSLWTLTHAPTPFATTQFLSFDGVASLYLSVILNYG
ncbi:hypothetical protein AURDEDRAFT_178370 [Auricularia subglabra TFB-10046 SS5]|uniref:Uncharacterized protein n=1 Tax=Auricularia subglabra (strain TFB-10046 / SS5) TaxID=717982 RepID=J0D1T0_AURST|nr:hypothetical protein AURDEDRAFT_178370 [Auricularia subglabra TFB-10046 SS5]